MNPIGNQGLKVTEKMELKQVENNNKRFRNKEMGNYSFRQHSRGHTCHNEYIPITAFQARLLTNSYLGR